MPSTVGAIGGSYSWRVDTLDRRAHDGVAAVAAGLVGRMAAVSADVLGVIEREIPVLRDDQRVAGMLDASVAENITTVLHALRHGIDTATIEAPTSAIEYARRLAQRGVSAEELVRAYRLGQARFTRLFIEELMAQTGTDQIDGSTVVLGSDQISQYIDRVVGRVLAMYDHERASWLQNRSAVQASHVRSILKGEHVDVDRMQTTLGYRLRQHHLGLMLWTDRTGVDANPLRAMAELTNRLASTAGCSTDPLFVPCDDTSAWAWLPTTPTQPPLAADLADVVAKDGAPVAVATGSPAKGVDGFRRTHRQAVAAQAVALAAGPDGARFTPFTDVAPIAMMCADLDSARAWIAETLGQLADATERNEGLRETARIFMRTGGSYAATADELFLHRNSVQYRVRQAEELRGRPFNDGRLDVELALLACHWLGPAILPTD
jgi:PucR C-terminal helix-turn-helix domain/GGDEF-like domain